MNHEFKVGDQFVLVESLGNAYEWDQSIAPNGKQFILVSDGILGKSPILLGNSNVANISFWINGTPLGHLSEIKPIGRFTITSLKNQRN